MRTPTVRTKSVGRVSQTLEKLAEAFRANNPGMDCRWVYDPKTKPELSNVMSRTADGYRKVKPSDLGDSGIPLEESVDEVRVADSILMGIEEGLRQQLMKERADVAAEQAMMVDRRYYQSIEEMEMAGKVPGTTHKLRPRGRSFIEEREFQYDVEQGTGEER